MSTLSREDVLHVARLARIHLEPEEVEHLREQLSSILTYVEQLQQLDVTDVEPTAQVTGLTTVMRPDDPLPPFERDVALSNAPEQLEGMFRVRAVFDE